MEAAVAVVPSWFQTNSGSWTVASCQQFYSAPQFGLCDLRLWGEPRSTDTVRSAMFSSLPSAGMEEDACVGLLGSWKLNDSLGVQAVDSSPHGHSAVLWDMAFATCHAKPYSHTAEPTASVSADLVTGLRVPFRAKAVAMRKCVMYTNGECLVVYHALADWLGGNPGYVGVYQVSLLLLGSPSPSFSSSSPSPSPKLEFSPLFPGPLH